MALTNTQEEAIFASVLADGKIHVASAEGVEGAVKREYETSDGAKGSKWEKVYTQLSGIISEFKFVEGNYGQQIFVTVKDGDSKPVTLTLSTNSNFGEDFMKKIFNVDMSKPVSLSPYSFEDDKGKNRKGITIIQDGNKIKNYFYDETNKKNINGYPNPTEGRNKQPKNADQWKMYFMEARLFLIDKVIEHFKLDKPKEKEIDPDSIPF